MQAAGFNSIGAKGRGQWMVAQFVDNFAAPRHPVRGIIGDVGPVEIRIHVACEGNGGDGISAGDDGLPSVPPPPRAGNVFE